MAAPPSADDIRLREYVDVRFEAQEKAVAAALAAQEKAVAAALAAADRAVAKAEVAAEKRFEGVNEFRATLSDQARTLMPRSESEQAIKTLTEKLDILTARVNARDERGVGMGQGWALLIAAAGFISAVIAILYATFGRS
jgi:hypothetical protein